MRSIITRKRIRRVRIIQTKFSSRIHNSNSMEVLKTNWMPIRILTEIIHRTIHRMYLTSRQEVLDLTLPWIMRVQQIISTWEDNLHLNQTTTLGSTVIKWEMTLIATSTRKMIVSVVIMIAIAIVDQVMGTITITFHSNRIMTMVIIQVVVATNRKISTKREISRTRTLTIRTVCTTITIIINICSKIMHTHKINLTQITKEVTSKINLTIIILVAEQTAIIIRSTRITSGTIINLSKIPMVAKTQWCTISNTKWATTNTWVDPKARMTTEVDTAAITTIIIILCITIRVDSPRIKLTWAAESSQTKAVAITSKSSFLTMVSKAISMAIITSIKVTIATAKVNINSFPNNSSNNSTLIQIKRKITTR